LTGLRRQKKFDKRSGSNGKVERKIEDRREQTERDENKKGGGGRIAKKQLSKNLTWGRVEHGGKKSGGAED